MLNFFTLEPKEFAELSRDILQKIVKKTLYLTDGPYDEGIDFTDNPQNSRIIGCLLYTSSGASFSKISADVEYPVFVFFP